MLTPRRVFFALTSRLQTDGVDTTREQRERAARESTLRWYRFFNIGASLFAVLQYGGTFSAVRYCKYGGAFGGFPFFGRTFPAFFAIPRYGFGDTRFFVSQYRDCPPRREKNTGKIPDDNPGKSYLSDVTAGVSNKDVVATTETWGVPRRLHA